MLGRAGESGQKKRKEAAKSGMVTWQTPKELREWAAEQRKRHKEASAESKQRAEKRPSRGDMPLEEDMMYD